MYNKAWYEAHRDKINEKRRMQHAEESDEVNEKRRQDYARRRNEILRKQREDRQESVSPHLSTLLLAEAHRHQARMCVTSPPSLFLF